MRELVSALDPGFRAQELSFAGIADRVEHRARRGRGAPQLDGASARAPAGGPRRAARSAQERAAAHVPAPLGVAAQQRARGDRRSRWRSCCELAGVQHSFWVVLGTLSVLRSNALSTGQNVVRGLVGTAAGFVVGAGLARAGRHRHDAALVAASGRGAVRRLAPAAISFAVGQAAFTLTLVILYNILEPSGWRVGLLRVEDIAIGCGVSLRGRRPLWPRGAAARSARRSPTRTRDSAHLPRGGRRASGSASATPGRRRRPRRPTSCSRPRRRRAASTTPIAATLPSAARSRYRSPR